MASSKDIVQTMDYKVDCKLNFNWEIKNFSEKFDVLESDELNLEPICISKWKLVLSCDEEGKMMLGLKRTNKSAHSVCAVADFTVRNSKGTFFVRRTLKTSYVWHDETKFCLRSFPKPGLCIGVKNDLNNQFRLNKDDTAIIDGSIAVVPCCLHAEPKRVAVDELHSALSSALRENIFSDVDFVIDGETFAAHKLILAARSPVFRKMFESGMIESTNNQITLTDIEKPVLKQFLEFLYTGSLPILDDMEIVLKLYVVSDKYDIQGLKTMCRHMLLLDITSENVCSMISVADMHKDEELYSAAISHIAKDFKKVFQTDGWKNLMRENIELSVKIISSVVPQPDDDTNKSFKGFS